MTTIHAYTRTKPVEVELFDTVVKFALNAKEHVVAEVSEKRIVDRLLEISEGYKVYGAAPTQPAQDDDDPVIETSPYVLTQEGDDGNEVTIDLRTLDKAALLKFCEDNDVKPLPPKNTGEQKIRDKIVEFFKVD